MVNIYVTHLNPDNGEYITHLNPENGEYIYIYIYIYKYIKPILTQRMGITVQKEPLLIIVPDLFFHHIPSSL